MPEQVAGAPQPPRRPDATPLPTEQAELLVPVLKALAHPIRLRLVSLVASHPDGEACVCTISSGFNVSGPTISHHLRMLREAGVLDCQRRGTWVYYRTRPQVLADLAKIIGTPMVCGDSSRLAVVRPAETCR
ncbi:metalloregulator ArsR/SmtB family transcription factor [Amycolatopsis sp. NPDC051071]|uniref:ArsR/SmtB family transcription factor n=1 Tax=Amycolatopsis sp. NPDC051071 TaxID=3154637 RepID=UPI0034479C0B